MTPQELKNSILQLAIQGKLVEQRAEEGTAEELYQQIQEEKQRLIDEKKIKKEKPLPEITEDEIPFDIPDSWKWVHFNYIANSSLGKTLDKVKNTGDFKPYLCSINVYWDGIRLEKVKEARFEETELSKYVLQKGDLLICEGGDVGRSCVWDKDITMYYQNALHRVRFYKNINPYFYKFLIECYKSSGIIDKFSKGVTIKHLVQSSLNAMWIPLPPLAEQKRIVEKIEQILPHIDQYEKAWGKLETFNKRFPDDMKKSLLQYAIEGKLVEQKPEEGTAEELYQQIQEEKQRLIAEKKIKKEKPLPEITEDEIPFDIPDSWKWVRLDNISYQIGDIDHKMPATVEKNGIPYISPINFTNDGKIDFDNAKKISIDDFLNLSKKCKPEKNDIIFPRYGTIGVIRMVETDQPFIVSYSCCTIKNLHHFIYPKYIFYVLQSKMIKDEINRYINKTTQPNVGLKSIKMFLFPLPPLAEQKRIVEKLEQMLPLCERLK